MTKSIFQQSNYKELKSYQNAVIIYDGTVEFCDLYIDRFSRTKDQMIQAARSGKQNIAEGCMASSTSKKTELKLIGVARASLQELLEDYLDFIRQNNLKRWQKGGRGFSRAKELAHMQNRSYQNSYRPYILHSKECAANMMACLVTQTNYLLDRQLLSLKKAFINNGGFAENLYNARKQERNY